MDFCRRGRELRSAEDAGLNTAPHPCPLPTITWGEGIKTPSLTLPRSTGRGKNTESPSARGAAAISLALLVLALGGCGSDIRDNFPTGFIDKGPYNDARLTNEQRIAGEDKRVIPIYRTPFEVIAIGFDALIGHPIAKISEYFSHDNAATAARKIFDPTSPDERRGNPAVVRF